MKALGQESRHLKEFGLEEHSEWPWKGESLCTLVPAVITGACVHAAFPGKRAADGLWRTRTRAGLPDCLGGL